MGDQVAAQRWSDEALWALCFLIFVLYFLFQALFPVQGYVPFSQTTYVTYVYRTMLAGALFFGLLLWLLPPRIRNVASGVALGLFLAASTLYFGVVVSARPSITPVNDRSEALSIALTHLFHGEFPYATPTHLGGPVTALSTSLLLAVPGHLLAGRPELMTIPVLLAGFAALLWHRRRVSAAMPVAVVALLLFLNPVIVWELVWGSDLIWAGALLALTLVLLGAGCLRWAAFAFGLALCTRFTFFVLVPLFAVHMFRRHRGQFAATAGIVAATVVILEVPLALWDTNMFFHYAPLGISAQKLALPAPSGDNGVSDVLELLLPTGLPRTLLISVSLVALASLLGWRAKSVSQLALSAAAVLSATLFFMGPHFLLDYLCWLVFPLLVALLGDARFALPESC